jgi:hypothetical protein
VISSASKARADAGENLKRIQAELLQAKREEVSAERAIEKTTRACMVAQRSQASADSNLLVASEAAAAAQSQFDTAVEALSVAENNLSHAMAELDSHMKALGVGVTSRSISEGAASHVGAPAAAANNSRKVFDRVQKAFDAMQAAGASSQVALTEALHGDTHASDCEVNVNIAEKLGAAASSVSMRDAKALLKVAERERVRVNKVFDKAAECTTASVEKLTQEISDLRGVVTSLADSLHVVDEKGLKQHIKAMQQELMTAIRNINVAWQAVKSAQSVKSKAEVAHRRAMQSKLSSAGACKEAQSCSADAAARCERFEEEASTCRVRRSACEAEVETARIACATAEEQDAAKRRKLETCKGSLKEAKHTLKTARLSEKEASAKREALYKHYASKKDTSVREELEVARSSAQASAENQQRAIAAIQALQAEEYDANQVVEAYESRKKPRLETDVAS